MAHVHRHGRGKLGSVTGWQTRVPLMQCAKAQTSVVLVDVRGCVSSQ